MEKHKETLEYAFHCLTTRDSEFLKTHPLFCNVYHGSKGYHTLQYLEKFIGWHLHSYKLIFSNNGKGDDNLSDFEKIECVIKHKIEKRKQMKRRKRLKMKQRKKLNNPG